MNTTTADLADRYGTAAQPCIVQFRHFGRRRFFGGQIETIKTKADVGLIIERLKLPGKGHVLVIDGQGSLRSALVGDKLAKLAIDNNWAGLVVYGAIRDAATIDSLEIGIHALGTVPTKGSKDGSGESNVPVSFGEVTFLPGQYVYCDGDGLIVLAQEAVTA